MANNIAHRVDATLAGLGLAYLEEDQIQTHIAKGRLCSKTGVRRLRVITSTTRAAHKTLS